jgi:putative copper resistance protein D
MIPPIGASTLPSGSPIPTGAPLGPWRLDPLAIAALLLAAWAYAAGVRGARARGARLPRGHPVCFFAGLVAILLALVSPIEAYGEVWFSAHVVQHLLLTVVAAPLIALGAPITLALAATSPELGRPRLLRLLRSGVLSIVSRPVAAFVLFLGSGYLVHLTSLYDVALRNPAVHVLEHFLFLGTALLFWVPLIGADPAPRGRPSYPIRLLVLGLAIPLEGFLALAISSSRTSLYEAYATLPPPWGPSALADQRAGAAVMWVVSDVAMIAAILWTAAAWRRSEEARTRAAERST